MTVARNVPTLGRVCLTEMEQGGALDHLRYNVDLNHELLGSRVETAACDWSLIGSPSTIPTTTSIPAECSESSTHDACAPKNVPVPEPERLPVTVLDYTWSFVIGSDLVYNEDGVDMLPKVLGKLTPPNVCTTVGRTCCTGNSDVPCCDQPVLQYDGYSYSYSLDLLNFTMSFFASSVTLCGSFLWS